MLSRYTTRLLTKSIAALQAFAIVVAPSLLASCQCGQAAAGSNPSDYCGPRCCPVQSKPCCTNGGSANDCQNCSCSPPIKQAPAVASVAPARADDSPAPSPFSLAVVHVADLGLHGADWSTAFDLQAPGGPPGLRLHALFSVWRN